MIACVCWTPFQIINAINYKTQYAKNEKMDIYVCDKFSDAENIVVRLNHLSYINKAYLVKNLDYDSITGIRKKMKILKDLFFIEKVVKECICEKVNLRDKNYSVVLSSGFLNFNIYFTNFFQRRGAKVIFFDDGVESYLEKNTVDQYSFIYRIISKITGNGGLNLKPEKLYVYEPGLVVDHERYKEVLRLKALDKLPDGIKEDLNYLFQYEKNDSEYKVIVFDQLGTGDFEDCDRLLREQEQILQLLDEQIGKDNIIIKLHPRTRKIIYDKKYKTLITNAPWEIFLLNEKLENKILIAISSTACMTPKLIFEQEPIAIFLYKLFSISGYESVDHYINRVKQFYANPQRVMIPDTIEELLEKLQKVI